MRTQTSIIKLIGVSLLLAVTACGSGSDSNTSTSTKITTGKLISQTNVSKNNTAIDLVAIFKKLTPAQKSITLVGTAKCDINVSQIRFSTKGAKGEAADSTAAVFTPTGSDPTCTGKRPVLLHAHGTAVHKDFDFSQVTDVGNEATLRSSMLATMFAGQGYIVVAPNYIGYGGSSLDYNGYLLEKQQSGEMADGLKAARAALPSINPNVSDSGKLFLTGYSQGGFVALATAKKLQNDGINVSGVVPMSGPYALAAFGDAIFAGNVNAGGTIFGPLMTKAYQKAYGDIYQTPDELYAGKYATTIENLLPGGMMFEQLYTSGSVPLALFQSAPTGIPALETLSPKDQRFSYGFSAENYLMNSGYRAVYLIDAQKNPDGLVPKVTTGMPSTTAGQPFRQALAKNDLRSYIPAMPVMLCGGNQDPTVFYSLNTDAMTNIWKAASAKGAPVKVAKLDVDLTNEKTNTFESAGLDSAITTNLQTNFQKIQGVFATEVKSIAAAASQEAASQVSQNGGSDEQAAAAGQTAAAQAVGASYHAIVAPYCAAAARDFFNEL